MLVVHAPRGYARLLADMPRGVRRAASGVGPFDVVHVFVRRAAALRGAIRDARRVMRREGMVWLSWPKRTSGVATDVDENAVRHAGLSLDLVDVKICAVDETWSALKFVIPLKLR